MARESKRNESERRGMEKARGVGNGEVVSCAYMLRERVTSEDEGKREA